METSSIVLRELRERVTVLNQASTQRIFIGFDGFVDKIKKAVKSKNRETTVYFDSLRDFASRISAASGKSGQIQMDVEREKLGGNAPILANTLGKLNIKTFCVGSMGYPERHRVFSDMNSLCETISVLDPGLSDAIEFADGKFIFSELQVFEKYDWSYIKKAIPHEKIASAVSASSLVACVDWANLPHASNIWSGLLNDLIKPSGRKDFLFLFDLCDPSKKSAEEVNAVLDLISQFKSCGQVTLGLNENETLKIWAAMNGHDLGTLNSPGKLPHVLTAGKSIYDRMEIDTLLVHPIDRCIAFRSSGILELEGRLVTKPKVLTGGGDNLNAGYCLGLISGFSTTQCLLLGMAASGSYIENGISPNINDILDYLDVWIADLQTRSANPSKYIQTITN